MKANFYRVYRNMFFYFNFLVGLYVDKKFDEY